MKKHIIGLALFSFIVSAAAVIYAVFSISGIVTVSEVITVSAPQYIPMERTNCRMKRDLEKSKDDSPFVTQAVFNVKTKRLSWKCAVSKGDVTYLHFWALDEHGLHHIDSIPVENCLRGERKIQSDWQELNLNKLSSTANLYLIPDTFIQSLPNETEYHPRFDINKAIPVTIDYGK